MLQSGISLCMIVKNAEHHMVRCLGSIKASVDQIIVVDTGSTDRTKAVAAEMGAEVYDFTWVNDFSAARNFSLSLARHEWIMVLDADHEVTFTRDQLAEAIDKAEQQQVNTIYLNVVDVDDHRTRYASYSQPQLWRNGQGVKYVNTIHETQTVSPRGIRTQLEILHYGYFGISPEELAEKRRRNMTMLTAEYNQSPDDTRVGWELAREYCAVRDFAAALPVIEHTIAVWRKNTTDIPPQPSMLEIRIQALVECGRRQEALHAIDEAQREQPDFPIFPLMRQRIFIIEQNWTAALDAFAQYAALVKRYRRGELQESSTPVFGLFEYAEAVKAAAQAAAMAGNMELTEAYFRESYAENAEKTIDALAAVADRIEAGTLLGLLKKLAEMKQTSQLRELLMAIVPQVPPTYIEALRPLIAILKNWQKTENLTNTREKNV